MGDTLCGGIANSYFARVTESWSFVALEAAERGVLLYSRYAIEEHPGCNFSAEVIVAR